MLSGTKPAIKVSKWAQLKCDFIKTLLNAAAFSATFTKENNLSHSCARAFRRSSTLQD